MTRVFTYLPKRLLFVALMLISSFAAVQAQTCEVQLSQEEVSAIVNSDKSYVFIGDEASTTLATMKEVLQLADWQDVAPNMRALIERADQGYKTALKDMVVEALEKEAPAILERHHAHVQQDAQLKDLVSNLDSAWNLVSTDALTIAVAPTRSEDEIDEATRACCNQTGSFTGLNVTGNGIISGNLRVGGTFSVGGASTFGNVLVLGNEVINGTLTVGNVLVLGNEVINGTLTVGGVVIDPIIFENAFVQGGNIFGDDAFLGTLDAFGLNLKTDDVSRLSIDSLGAVSIGTPVSGDALTIDAEPANSGLVIRGGPGAPAQIITPGLNAIALDLEGSGTAPTLVVRGAAIVNNGDNVTFQAFPTTHFQPLYAGGTQANASLFVGAFDNTFAPGASRMIWAQIAANGTVVAQSGGITNVQLGGSTFTITYLDFTDFAPIVLATADVTGGLATPTAIPGLNQVTIDTYSNSGVPAAVPFSVLIMGQAR